MKWWNSTAFTLVAALSATHAMAQTPAAVTAPAAATQKEPLAEALRSYVAFQSDISSLAGGRLATANDLNKALDTAAAQNLDSLTRGWIAYGAMTAAQSKDFVASVREISGFYGKDAFMNGLMLDPSYASSLAGGTEALRLALDAAHADGDRVFKVGEQYKEMAYSLQKQRWANAVAPGQQARVARMKSLAAGASARAIDASIEQKLIVAPGATAEFKLGAPSFWDSLRATPAAAAPSAAVQTQAIASGPAPVFKPHRDRASAFHRMTSLAALYAIDSTNAANAQTDRLLADRPSRNCVEMAQAQFYQCMSAARFQYENAFCLGEHALKDMGSCIRDAAVADAPLASAAQATPLLTAPAAKQ